MERPEILIVIDTKSDKVFIENLTINEMSPMTFWEKIEAIFDRILPEEFCGFHEGVL